MDTLFGFWFVRGQLLRDFAALNKIETVPLLVRLSKGLSWDSWRLVSAKDPDLSPADIALPDQVAGLTVDPDAHFAEIQALYQSEPALQVPDEIFQR